MEYLAVDHLSDQQKREIILLWNNEYPLSLSYTNLEEFNQYLSPLSDQKHLLIVNENKLVKAWYFDFIRAQVRWFAMIIDKSLQGQGLGTQILDRAKAQNEELNGWVTDQDNFKKANGKYYKSPLQFYIKNNFKVQFDIKLKTEKLSAVKIKWEK